MTIPFLTSGPSEPNYRPLGDKEPYNMSPPESESTLVLDRQKNGAVNRSANNVKSEDKQSKPLKWEDLVPYKLDPAKARLFPEFYFHFKKNFASISTQHKDYCLLSRSELYPYLPEFPENKRIAIKNLDLVIQDYDRMFKLCLDSELLEDYGSVTLSRHFVESVLEEAIKSRADLTSYPRRLDELMKRARSGDAKPLVDFLSIYEYSEAEIWHYVFLTYVVSFEGPKRDSFMNSRAAFWQSAEVPLTQKIESFVNDLKTMGRETQKGDFVYFICSLCVSISMLIFFGVVVVKAPSYSTQNGENAS